MIWLSSFQTFLDTLLNAEALYDLLATTAPDLYALLLPLLHIDCSKCVYCPECLGALQTLIDNNISLAIGNITTPFNASAFTTQRVDDLLFTGYVNPIIREMVLSLVDLLLHTNLISSDIPVPIPPVAINVSQFLVEKFFAYDVILGSTLHILYSGLIKFRQTDSQIYRINRWWAAF